MDSGNDIWVGVSIDENTMNKVKERLSEEYSNLVPQAALYRILIGMFADGLISIDLKDVKLYSAVSLMRGRPRGSQ